MAYDWQTNSEGAAEPIPAGTHDLTIARVIYEKRDGTPFTSGSGDPQIMLVFADAQGREAAEMFTLSEKAAWTLARLLSGIGANLAKMTQDGVEPKHFADPRFSDAQLVGRKFKAQVSYRKSDKDGKDYADVVPIKPRATAPAASSPSTQPAPTPAPAPAPAPAPTPAAAADDGPPAPEATDPEKPKASTKAEAWEIVKTAWAQNTAPDAKAKRAQAWTGAVSKRNKPEAQFAAADWQAVADEAALPF